MIARIALQDTTLAKDARVQTLTMDMAMDVFNREEEVLPGVHFRLMPDMKQVQNAMTMYAQEGVAIKKLVGIPVFQAEGLVISTESAV